MAWQKSPPELIALFDAVLPGAPVERRLMFGYPSGFVNGRLAFGLFEDKLVLRLPPFALDALLRAGGKPFTPTPERTMSGFATMPKQLLVDGPGLRGWIHTAVQHAQSLPFKGMPETEQDLPSAPAAKKAAKKPARKPAQKTAKKAAKRAAAAKKPTRKPARKVAKKPAKKPARRVAKRPAKKAGKKAKSSAARKGARGKRAPARRKSATRKPAWRARRR